MPDGVKRRIALMVPLYAARIEDIGPNDRVTVECVCGHTAALSAPMLTTAGLPPGVKVLDLKRRLRCQGCGVRGRAVVSIAWDKLAV